MNNSNSTSVSAGIAAVVAIGFLFVVSLVFKGKVHF